jgi:hypothetical protein
VRVLVAEFDFVDQDQTVGPDEQTHERVAFDIVLVSGLLPAFPEFVDFDADIQRRVLLGVGYGFSRPLPEEVMQQDEQFQHNQASVARLL